MSELILTAKNHLKHIMPKALDIDIKVTRDHEFFVSRVHVHLPGGIIHAEKKADNYSEALDEACEAAIRQMQKFKSKRGPKRKEGIKQQMPLVTAPP